jgi:outer membrane protein OmpA-like peptidoglycan-associated protein
LEDINVKPFAVAIMLASFFFLICGFAAPAFGGNGLRVFRVEVGSVDEKVSETGNDFYINGGKADGLREGMIIDVFRPKTVSDHNEGEEYNIRIFIGQLRIIKLFDNMAIARIHSIDSSENSPIVTYRTVMVGDYAVPSKRKDMSVEQNGVGLRNNNEQSIMLPTSVLFEFDKWHITNQGVKALSSVQDKFTRLPHHKVIIAGYTCDLGTSKYNWDLSMRRAQSVAHYLIQNGIRRSQVDVEYYGESFPRVPNDTEENRAKNRRVEIRIEPSAKG